MRTENFFIRNYWDRTESEEKDEILSLNQISNHLWCHVTIWFILKNYLFYFIGSFFCFGFVDITLYPYAYVLLSIPFSLQFLFGFYKVYFLILILYRLRCFVFLWLPNCDIFSLLNFIELVVFSFVFKFHYFGMYMKRLGTDWTRLCQLQKFYYNFKHF